MQQTNKISLATARCIPVILVLILIYVCYVVIHPLTINYFLSPPRGDITRRLDLGIAVPVVYFVLLLPVVVCYSRLLQIVLLQPGYVELGPEPRPGVNEPHPGLEEYYNRDAFVCDQNGWPIWCGFCNNWKTNRGHHNQDTGRCVAKLDHYCPWVGGVVGERSYKFFFQFLFYTMIFTAYLVAIFGWVVARYKGNVQFFVVLGLAGFFCLFTTGMVLNSLDMTLKNTSTIESQNNRRTYMAVVLPPERQIDPMMLPPPARLSRSSSDGEGDRPKTSEIDDESHINYFKRRDDAEWRPALSKRSSERKIWKGSITYPLHLPIDRPPIPAVPQRHFAILQLPPGLNPFNLGSAYRNLTAVFGDNILDWILPLKHSPCCDHTSGISEYPLGPEFELMLADAGLVRPISSTSKERRPSTTRRRNRRRKLDPGWQNGERPPGWINYQEARRMRKHWEQRAHLGHHPDAL